MKGCAELVGDGNEGGDILREAGAAIAQSGIEEAASDATIHADALGHFFDISTSSFADFRDGIDVGDFQREEAVGGVLDQFGAVDVGDENRCHERLIYFLHHRQRAVAVATNDDAVGFHEVIHRAAFAEELGIADDIEFHTGLGIAADGLGDALAGFHGHGAFVHDDAVAAEADGDFTRDLFDETEVNTSIFLRRGGHRNEDHFAVIDSIGGAGGELEALGDNVFAHHGFETRLVDGNFPCQQAVDFGFVIVHAENMVADLGETGTCGESDIAGADDCDLHVNKVRGRLKRFLQLAQARLAYLHAVEAWCDS